MLECVNAEQVSSDSIEPEVLFQIVKLLCRVHFTSVDCTCGANLETLLFPRQTAFNRWDTFTICQKVVGQMSPCRYNDTTNSAQDPNSSRAAILNPEDKSAFSGWHSFRLFGHCRASFISGMSS